MDKHGAETPLCRQVKQHRGQTGSRIASSRNLFTGGERCLACWAAAAAEEEEGGERRKGGGFRDNDDVSGPNDVGSN